MKKCSLRKYTIFAFFRFRPLSENYYILHSNVLHTSRKFRSIIPIVFSKKKGELNLEMTYIFSHYKFTENEFLKLSKANIY